MTFLKPKNWYITLILNVITGGLFNLILGYYLNVYEENAWYTKWYYFVVGIIFLFFAYSLPLVILVVCFVITIKVLINKKLDTPGSELYSSPYTWMILLIVPIVGWCLFIVLDIYLTIYPSIMIYQKKDRL